MIRDAAGRPIALPLALLPSVPIAANLTDLTRYLNQASDALTAQAMMRHYIEARVTTLLGPSLSADLDQIGRRFPRWAHEVFTTKRIYNLPPFEVPKRRQLAASYPDCECVRCGKKREGLEPAHAARSGRTAARYSMPSIPTAAVAVAASAIASRSARRSTVSAISELSARSIGSGHTRVVVGGDYDYDDPPPPYSVAAVRPDVRAAVRADVRPYSCCVL
ncbi:hypothetical protein CspeluHIS016_0100720 [Cutaneotrichosporon spelunceum]|uniref:Uncharacterized protein n=1 Tax=Cutaneotrichosporon spelunceum TaxID=1672016 RepID=A0AAD3TLY6_9TREE|nr:hypothetical protein CspeluHIS016_0100720 [Cutaneotrichosporon spelunceum]